MTHVIIGVGAAGIMAAKTIRELEPDARIIMISVDDHVHSRCMLHKYLSRERSEETLSFVPDDFFEAADITWIKNREVIHIDTAKQEVELDDRTRISYDRLLIATGAHSVFPPIMNFKEAKNVFGLRNLSDAQKIRAFAEKADRILIFGSGLVGMDAAYGFLEQDKDVTVVEMADRILPKQLDETAGNAYQKLFEQHGCKFLLGKKAVLTAMPETDRITSVLFDDGTIIECDMIVVAAGVRPAVSCAADSGIFIDRYIRVDDFMKTSCDHIYAAGDVNGISGIWPNAMKQGYTAACNMCGIPTPYEDKYGMKNTMNFYGLTTLSLGDGMAAGGDEIIIREDSRSYKKAILHDGCLKSLLIQGDLDYSGIYQYLIKNQIPLDSVKTDIFHLSFADFYGIDKTGQYCYQIAGA
ncbi:NAD(P)/FAD-dependent oxidoreductase [Clostridium sp. Marseille-P2415]|uniref:NAD(P)/FAD-dependent oxidoreductase n=1 Tax=Clostridium sp. Marseille-P2415 TaxID=1805471 RepID=UPI0009883291|nr:FAD-dependent oxidoreductase [Clostridium sp. Marseille-P2415]